VKREALFDCIRSFLTHHGIDEEIIALHEGPSGPGSLECLACRKTMVIMKIRGVEVDYCQPCEMFFLEREEMNLIEKRVLVSAESPKSRYPLSRHAKLERILQERDPSPG
jgi:Zn-finger nucleic acid-binding protein